MPFANLQSSDLENTKFNEATNLMETTFAGACVRSIDFTEVELEPDQLSGMFGDASVILSDGRSVDHPDWPDHWSKEVLDWTDFRNEWRAFQRSIGQDPNNPE